MFGMNDKAKKQEEIALILLDLKKDLGTLNHSINTLKNNTNDLHRTIFTDKDSVIIRLTNAESEISQIRSQGNDRKAIWTALITLTITFIASQVWTVIVTPNPHSPQNYESTTVVHK